VADITRPAGATAPRTSSADTRSAQKWHSAVLEAATRTLHELTTPDSPRDDRYRSADPAVDALWQALREVADPELPISLVDLGLICDVRLHDGTAEVDVTFTASACPCMEFILDDIRDRLLRLDAVERVAVRDVWDPPWTTARMTAHGRTLLRSFGTAVA
jgi:metal-sulfur cluster biosynthetic enzyme